MKEDETKISVDTTTIIGEREEAIDFKLPLRHRVHLEVIEGNERGRVFEFKSGRVVVGRSGADFTIMDEKISRKHFSIETWSRDQIYLRDLASTNGTFLNGSRIQSTKIKNGDIIQAGDTKFRFVIEEIK